MRFSFFVLCAAELHVPVLAGAAARAFCGQLSCSAFLRWLMRLRSRFVCAAELLQ